MLFDLVSYVDVQVQSNPFYIERRQACTNMNVAGKNVVVESEIEYMGTGFASDRIK